jgi:hypothetical protein
MITKNHMLPKDEKRELKKSNKALSDLIRRAKQKGAFIEEIIITKALTLFQ